MGWFGSTGIQYLLEACKPTVPLRQWAKRAGQHEMIDKTEGPCCFPPSLPGDTPVSAVYLPSRSTSSSVSVSPPERSAVARPACGRRNNYQGTGYVGHVTALKPQTLLPILPCAKPQRTGSVGITQQHFSALTTGCALLQWPTDRCSHPWALFRSLDSRTSPSSQTSRLDGTAPWSRFVTSGLWKLFPLSL